VFNHEGFYLKFKSQNKLQNERLKRSLSQMLPFNFNNFGIADLDMTLQNEFTFF